MDAGGAVDIVVRHKAHRMRADGTGQNAARLQRGYQGVRIAAAAQGKDDDVALHRVQIERNLRQCGQTLGKNAGIGMVLMEARRLFRPPAP